MADSVQAPLSIASERGSRLRPPAVKASATLVLGLALVVAACARNSTGAGTTPEPAPESSVAALQVVHEAPFEARVVNVVDGDTIDIAFSAPDHSDAVERIRLIGIDAPESVSRRDPVQCFGPEASQAMKDLLPPGTPVIVERDAELRDRYGRLLAYVHRRDDDLFINRWMLQEGLADTMFFAPNTTFETDFTSVRNNARSAPVGLWASCDGPDQPLE